MQAAATVGGGGGGGSSNPTPASPIAGALSLAHQAGSVIGDGGRERGVRARSLPQGGTAGPAGRWEIVREHGNGKAIAAAIAGALEPHLFCTTSPNELHSSSQAVCKCRSAACMSGECRRGARQPALGARPGGPPMQPRPSSPLFSSHSVRLPQAPHATSNSQQHASHCAAVAQQAAVQPQQGFGPPWKPAQRRQGRPRGGGAGRAAGKRAARGSAARSSARSSLRADRSPLAASHYPCRSS